LQGETEIAPSYTAALGRFPLLTADHERELAAAIQAGKQPGASAEVLAAAIRARDILVTSNLRLVFLIARKYGTRGLPLADVIAEGNLGLFDAAQRFDPDRGTRFATYAGWWIRQRLQKMLPADGPLCVPLHARHDVRAIEKVRLELDLDRLPGERDVMQALGWGQQKARTALQTCRTLGQSTCNGPVLATLADRRATPEEDAAEADELAALRRALGLLPERSRWILTVHFGLDGQRRRSMRWIARKLDLSVERVSQVIEAALRRLRKRLRGCAEGPAVPGDLDIARGRPDAS
jgi:RNA polymerase sigma factor (sigma-70 family)